MLMKIGYFPWKCTNLSRKILVAADSQRRRNKIYWWDSRGTADVLDIKDIFQLQPFISYLTMKSGNLNSFYSSWSHPIAYERKSQGQLGLSTRCEDNPCWQQCCLFWQKDKLLQLSGIRLNLNITRFLNQFPKSRSHYWHHIRFIKNNCPICWRSIAHRQRTEDRGGGGIGYSSSWIVAVRFPDPHYFQVCRGTRLG